MPDYWMIVGTRDNLEVSRSLGWTVQGFKSRHGKKAAAMRPGDMLIYYVTQRQAFAAVARVVTFSYEAHDRIWKSDTDPEEDYPWRVGIELVAALAPDDLLPAEPVAHALSHVRKWPAANWTLAFQGNVHLLPQADGELLAGVILQAAGAGQTGP